MADLPAVERQSKHFTSSSEAFRRARVRRSVSADLEALALHMSIYDAREDGMSPRATARALRVPLRVVLRHWSRWHTCDRELPVFGSAEAWQASHADVWEHDPMQAADNFVPYEWEETGTTTTVRRRPRPGRAHMLVGESK